MEPPKVDPLRQNIMEGVECLRLRKCRPDREAIAHHVLRKFGSTINEIFAELENIVDEGGLIKVEYKGTTSYRNPQNFDTKSSPLLTKHSKILNSSKTTRHIISGVNELLAKDPTYSEIGVPLTELKKKLVEFDGVRFKEDNVNALIEREIGCGSILIGRSSLAKEESQSLRVFPKDIPVPQDMPIISSLTSEESSSSSPVDERKKRTRKSSASSPATTPKKKKKTPVKNGSSGMTKEMDFDFEEEVETEEVPESPNEKKPVSRLGKKIVAEKVAEAVRKSYESTAEFESTSAQMIKLAEAVVAKHVEPSPPSLPKGPSLVLASSMIGTEEASHINGESSGDRRSKDSNEVSATATPVTTPKKGKAGVKLSETNPRTSDASSGGEDKSSSEQTATRSKRDKRKKTVFDPSDLPKTSNKNTRLSDNLSAKSVGNKPKKSSPATASCNRGKQSVKSKVSSQPLETSEDEEILPPGNSSSAATAPTEEATNLTCSYCEKDLADDDHFLTCSTCHANMHPTCMEYSMELYHRLKDCISKGVMNWECIECKRCGRCQKNIMEEAPTATTGEAENNDRIRLCLCDNCDVGYHAKCIGLPADKDIENWICNECVKEKEVASTKVKKEPGSNSKASDPTPAVPKNRRNSKASRKASATPASGSRKNSTEEANNMESPKEDIKPPIPIAVKSAPGSGNDTASRFPADLRLWSKEDVEQYFVEKGLNEEAANLFRQEVDGYSLLLLQREDIVSGMGFRLGPALKVFRLVNELQQKAPVQPHSSWAATESEKAE